MRAGAVVAYGRRVFGSPSLATGFSHTHMGPEAVSGFEAAMRDALDVLCDRGVIPQQNGRLQLTIEATVAWRKPLSPVFTP